MIGRAMSFAVGVILATVPTWADDIDHYVETTDKRIVCSFGYSHQRRSTATYAGLPTSQGYQRDHRIPICLGGADTPANVTYQELSEAHHKDRVEHWACKSVCNGEMSLRRAQSMFLYDNWRAAYYNAFGVEP